ncbi:hypothetical protein [Nitrosomonas sp. Nm166]|uniref:hypothetical protein n=1 Tax=Nitrosomonas sp. Nm166 TaxID=1881054 RepID=UPI0008E403A1|nr:hypothetical protein [Nitrosomonas sp. Nm166]SFE85768.1 hypothetical protein SAMN05428977_103321 [Nitrosomonas sp. Nm166]
MDKMIGETIAKYYELLAVPTDLSVTMTPPIDFSVVPYNLSDGIEENIIKLIIHIRHHAGTFLALRTASEGAWCLQTIDLEAKDIGKLTC